VNNIDLRYGFPVGGQLVDIVGANLRDTGKLAVFKINPNYTGGNVLKQIADKNSTANLIQKDSYGFTLYKRPSDGSFYVFDLPKQGGKLRQYRIEDDGTGSGVKVTPVRDLNYTGGTAEGLPPMTNWDFFTSRRRRKAYTNFMLTRIRAATASLFLPRGMALPATAKASGFMVAATGAGIWFCPARVTPRSKFMRGRGITNL
jgi:hypothetical protein